METTTVRIFVSSPGDVEAERKLSEGIFHLLRLRYSGILNIETFYWEHEPLSAETDPQSQTESPANYDIVVCILWSRLGMRLHPDRHHRADGSSYDSGTQYELEVALAANRATSGKPKIYIFKRGDVPLVSLVSHERKEPTEQWDALVVFYDQLMRENGSLISSENTYKGGLAGFERVFYELMSKVLAAYVPAGYKRLRSAVHWPHESPFRGLEYFEFKHALVFAGRTRAIDTVLDKLRGRFAHGEDAFVLVFGASGVGKSSFVRAGITPYLVSPGVVEGIGLWRHAAMRPSAIDQGDLFDALAAALLSQEAFPEIAEGPNGIDPVHLAQMLREGGGGAAMLVTQSLARLAAAEQVARKLPAPPRACFVLVVDQLEELFTVTRLEDQREKFLGTIRALAQSRHAMVIATVRSDFFSLCENSPVLLDLKSGEGSYHLEAPNEQELGQMIHRPAVAAGLEFEENLLTGERLEDILLQAALRATDALPMLEFTLDELYKDRDQGNNRLLLRTYTEMEGLEGSVGKRAEKVFEEAAKQIGQLVPPEDAASVFGQVFRHLVSLGLGDRKPAVRRSALKSDVAGTEGCRILVRRLVDGRLFTTDQTDKGVAVISVAHEALMTRWNRLKLWIELHRETLENRVHVETSARRWATDGGSLYTDKTLLAQAKHLLKEGFLSEPTERSFVETGLREAARERFRLGFQNGNPPKPDDSERVAYPDIYHTAWVAALEGADASVRCQAARLVGQEAEPSPDLAELILRLVVDDKDDAVRRACAASLVAVDRAPLFARLLTQLRPPRRDIHTGNWYSALYTRFLGRVEGELGQSDVIGGLARINIAAEASAKESTFTALLRRRTDFPASRVRIRTRFLRLRRGLPLFFLLLASQIILSVPMAALFKTVPGIFNFALCQADPNPLMAFFHGATAAIGWGSMITLGLIFHWIVFATKRSEQSYRHLFASAGFGGFFGLLGSIGIITLIVGVFTPPALYKMGWAWEENTKGVDILWESGFYWPYLILGTSLGVGTAVFGTRMRVSKAWRSFCTNQQPITDWKQVVRMQRELAAIARRFMWPIIVSQVVGCVLAVLLMQHYRLPPNATARPQPSNWWQRIRVSCNFNHWDGVDLSNKPLEEKERLAKIQANKMQGWKTSLSGEILGTLGDAATQVFGAFYCVVGMGIGLVAINKGVTIEPRDE